MQHKINEKITAKEVRLVGADGEMIGVVPTRRAIEIAKEAGLDLVEISPNASPPVCKILNYSKFRYTLQKKDKEAKKKQKKIETKEIKLSPRIAGGDYQIKLRNAKKFIEEGNKVRVSLAFRGREITHNEVGFAIINRFMQDMLEVSEVELAPKMEGKQILMILTAKK